jgi:hypothetical protein
MWENRWYLQALGFVFGITTAFVETFPVVGDRSHDDGYCQFVTESPFASLKSSFGAIEFRAQWEHHESLLPRTREPPARASATRIEVLQNSSASISMRLIKIMNYMPTMTGMWYRGSTRRASASGLTGLAAGNRRIFDQFVIWKSSHFSSSAYNSAMCHRRNKYPD